MMEIIKGLGRFLREQAVPILMFLVVAGLFLYGLQQTETARAEEEARMAEDSVRRAVVSCYSIEGRYPDSYEYLEENYGLTIDDSKYIVHYEVFADNIMPEITITTIG